MERVICFDTETTGFDYAGGDKIIEIGAVEISDGRITDNSFHEYVNPEGRRIPASSYDVHKISEAFLKDKPAFAEVARRFLDFAGGSLIVAHNGRGFDFPFVNFQLRQAGLPEIPPERQADTMLMAQRKITNIKSYSLDSLAKYFNISLEARADAHGALIDTNILAQIYLELVKRTDQKTVQEIMSEQHQNFLNAPKFGKDFPRRVFSVPPEELAAHDEWMSKTIKSEK